MVLAFKTATKDDLIGVIGLGRMGGAMAANMVKNGFKVMGFDPVEESRQAFVQKGGIAAASNEEIARSCRHIILSLPSAKALGSVIEVLKAEGQPGTCVMECSTLALEDKQSASDALEGTDVCLLDTPLSGNGFQAAVGDLVVYFSGDKAACEACYPFIEACSRAHYYIGGFGAGIKMKFVANLLVTVHNVVAGEAMLLGEHLGLDPQMVYEVIKTGAGSSRMFESRASLMAKKEYRPVSMTNAMMVKDVTLIHDAIEKTGVYAPLFEVGYEVVKACSEDETLAQEDTAAAHAYLDRKGKYHKS